MPNLHTEFHYVPTSGPIPGKSVLEQTERAINELGGVINDVNISAQQGIDIANTALTTATDALGTAQGALDAANSAADGVEEVRQLAQNAQSSADIANQAAQTAQSTADTALEASGAAASQSGEASTAANEAKDTAQIALDTANSADNTAKQALAIAESNTDSYEVEEEALDLDSYTEAGDKIYAANESLLNAPVSSPLFLRVGVSSDDLHVTQECWSEERPERKYSRSGVVTIVEGEGEEEEAVVTFSKWETVNSNENKYELCEFYYFRHPTLRPGFQPAQGGLLANAATLYPEAWAYLQTTEGQKLCKTEAEWQAMTTATWATLADGTKVGWNGIGGAPFFAPNTATGELRLPDLRGMYAEAAGYDSLGVGGVHGDAIRELGGAVRYIAPYTSDAVMNYAFSPIYWESVGQRQYSALASGTSSYGEIHLKASRQVPIAAKNQPRAWGALACVYLGQPAS